MIHTQTHNIIIKEPYQQKYQYSLPQMFTTTNLYLNLTNPREQRTLYFRKFVRPTQLENQVCQKYPDYYVVTSSASDFIKGSTIIAAIPSPDSAHYPVASSTRNKFYSSTAVPYPNSAYCYASSADRKFPLPTIMPFILPSLPQLEIVTFPSPIFWPSL